MGNINKKMNDHLEARRKSYDLLKDKQGRHRPGSKKKKGKSNY